ncbi:nose resistant to fluoxetine protein 6-like [Pararge aegeria]|uniref:Jg5349 protein n=1 Tax=Pararge aegeria aegeria TaxID=348720 RepID=A0A8S4R776_9NEOP|nr:nose resistant to fluoxetine protein 6-like [Pararge aegeria]CAH2232726.1 jg5349 [Pararge aegeria aegeria]
MELNISLLVLISVFAFSNGRLVIDEDNSRTFDKDLYDRVLDSEECEKQMAFLRTNDSNLYGRFLDSGMRTPRGLFMLSGADLGDYYQCLGIEEKRQDMNIQGKYCFLQIPFNQTIEVPFAEEYIILPRRDFTNMKIVHFDNGIISEAQSFAVGKRDNINRVEVQDVISKAAMNVAICIPKVCTSLQFTQRSFNLSSIGFQFEEQFCRLPNDKPWVPVDYVAIVIFSLIALLTVLGTAYDITHLFILKKDPKSAIIYIRMFSVYTNTRRLVTFAPNANALDCLDGVRSISMMWVIVGHAFSMHNFNYNLLDGIKWVTSGDAVWVSTGLFSVDSFFLMAGLLLVYTSVGKMSGTTFLKRLHVFYINRLLRMFPLLASLVLLEASVFHRMVDGPYWVEVARNAERCRTFWWTTLLHVQNYVNPDDICIRHSWYIAIDIQLHIVSPLVLFWVLGSNKKAAWSALVSGLLAILAASTIWNFMKDMPATNMTIPRLEEQPFYMRNYYMNALTRGSPFFVGMIVGYILNIYKGQEIRLKKSFMLVSWTIALGLIASGFYTSYLVMQLDWDNQVGDNLFNSFMRALWAIGLGWIIFACAKGYGGPINWLLTLSIWKIPARISFAMYLYHYPIMFLVAGMQLSPQFFSQGARIFDFMAFLVISVWVSYLVTVVIDAPFSTVIKMVIGAGQKKRSPRTEKVADLSKPSALPEKDRSLLENNIILTTLQKDDHILEKNDLSLQRNGPLLEKRDLQLQQNGPISEKDDLCVEKNGRVKNDLESNISLKEESVKHLDKNEVLVRAQLDSDLETKEVSKF